MDDLIKQLQDSTSQSRAVETFQELVENDPQQLLPIISDLFACILNLDGIAAVAVANGIIEILEKTKNQTQYVNDIFAVLDQLSQKEQLEIK